AHQQLVGMVADQPRGYSHEYSQLAGAGSVPRTFFQNGNRRQRPAFQELQESPAARRDIADLVAYTVFRNRSQGIASAGNGKPVRIGNRLRHHLGAVGKGIEFEYAYRTVPDDGAGLRKNTRQLLGGLRADRSEEHTSELQSRENLVCRLLLEK